MCEAPWIVARHHPLFYVTISGRIMSCSSCSRMWQCQTYSLALAMPGKRVLGGTLKGTVGRSNFMITVVHVAWDHADRLLQARLVGRPDAGPVQEMSGLTGVCLDWFWHLRNICSRRRSARQHVHVDEMEVNRVNISGQVEDLPDLGRTRFNDFGWTEIRRCVRPK